MTFKNLLLTYGGGFGDESNIKIGRSPPLSSITHFAEVLDLAQPLMACQMILLSQRYTRAKNAHLQLRRETGIPYNDMLFFDDCNWTDHCAIVAKVCKGVVTQVTPKVSQSISRLLLCTHSVSAVDLRHILSGNRITFLTVIIL